MNEQRSAARSKTHLFGRIVFGPDRAVCDCLVRDLSSGGARLYLVNAVSMPNEFELHIPSRGQVCHVFLKWRQRYQVGVKFISVAARAVGSARRRWAFRADDRCIA
jgi:hypothetical protein